MGLLLTGQRARLVPSRPKDDRQHPLEKTDREQVGSVATGLKISTVQVMTLTV